MQNVLELYVVLVLKMPRKTKRNGIVPLRFKHYAI